MITCPDCPNCGAKLDYCDSDEEFLDERYTLTEYYSCPNCQKDYDLITNYSLKFESRELKESD